VISCRDTTELATDYLERALPLRSALGLRLHLWQCEACRRYLDQLRKTARLLAAHPLPTASPETEARIIALAQGAPPTTPREGA
jgi:predicted anti-sigma-YlaC factor YlaD